MSPSSQVVSISVEERTDDRVAKLRSVLGVLTPRGGPSNQAVQTALLDGKPEVIAKTILEHTIEGEQGRLAIESILELEPSGRLARFLATELKLRSTARD